MSLLFIAEKYNIKGVLQKLSKESQSNYAIKEEIVEYEKDKFVLKTSLFKEKRISAYITTLYPKNGKEIKDDLTPRDIWIERLQTFPGNEGLNLGRILVCYHMSKFSQEGYTDVHLQAVSGLFEQGKVKSEDEANEIIFKYYRKMGFSRREPMEFNLMKAKISDMLKYCSLDRESTSEKEEHKQVKSDELNDLISDILESFPK